MLIFGLILLFFVLVDAGHPLWESSTKIKRAIPLDLSLDFTTTWPGGVVPFCWENDATRLEFIRDLHHAMNLWYTAGLPEPRFRFYEVSYEDCMRDRRNSLVIHKADGPLEFATTVGKYTGPPSDLLPGSVAYFNSETEIPSGRVARNTIAEKIAHEIGHIFGLYHEHQDPYFWRPPSPVFEIVCPSIEGFEQATEHLDIVEIYGPDGICVNQHTALYRGWNNVAHFLPILELAHLARPPPPHVPENSDVDWDSIMLYPSTTALNQNRGGFTLRKAKNGRAYRIPIKRAPSTMDVQGLIYLYFAAEQRQLPRLYHDPRSEYYTAFQNLQNFQVCDWPPTGPRGG
ncbi:uncharacterized protein KD926_000707 [Aspergillus affinis]|uniref:uncharacterized protein n=1 Tax=Aspergillus affinis TaxID=1070780 RepID=UPI0022FEA73C|nr:uncharacterized protein KD926_000707 [Aspergillus affinis]KAI9037270.1 hypothetical protein KD926_000707 [Aspergillus affinis]